MPEDGGAALAAVETLAPAIDAYLFVVDKRVSGQLAPLSRRNASLWLHPSVVSASVAPPGRQGARGFEELRRRHRVSPPPPGPRRAHRASVEHTPRGLRVTVELLGGGGALVRLTAAPGARAALTDACFGAGSWLFDVAAPGLNQGAQANINFALKAPSWAYDSWHSRYRPYAGLEVTAGRSFEDGEQTDFQPNPNSNPSPNPNPNPNPKQVSRRAFCSVARSLGRRTRPLRRRRRRRGRGPASTFSRSAHRLPPSCATIAGRPQHSARGWTTATRSATSSRSSPHPLARRKVAKRSRRPRLLRSTGSIAATAGGVGCCSGAM